MNKPLTTTGEIEARSLLSPVQWEQRAEGASPVFYGYPIVFNSRSEDLGGFVEIVDPSAFDGADVSDCIACFEHERVNLLGTVRSGTVRLKVDNMGVRAEIDPCEATVSKDCQIYVQRGDVQGMSYRFTVTEDKWDYNASPIVRTITKLGRVLDVTLTTLPAYKDTSVAMRSLEANRPIVEPHTQDIPAPEEPTEEPTVEARSEPTPQPSLAWYRMKNNIHRNTL